MMLIIMFSLRSALTNGVPPSPVHSIVHSILFSVNTAVGVSRWIKNILPEDENAYIHALRRHVWVFFPNGAAQEFSRLGRGGLRI